MPARYAAALGVFNATKLAQKNRFAHFANVFHFGRNTKSFLKKKQPETMSKRGVKTAQVILRKLQNAGSFIEHIDGNTRNNAGKSLQ